MRLFHDNLAKTSARKIWILSFLTEREDWRIYWPSSPTLVCNQTETNTVTLTLVLHVFLAGRMPFTAAVQPYCISSVTHGAMSSSSSSKSDARLTRTLLDSWRRTTSATESSVQLDSSSLDLSDDGHQIAGLHIPELDMGPLFLTRSNPIHKISYVKSNS